MLLHSKILPLGGLSDDYFGRFPKQRLINQAALEVSLRLSPTVTFDLITLELQSLNVTRCFHDQNSYCCSLQVFLWNLQKSMPAPVDQAGGNGFARGDKRNEVGNQKTSDLIEF